MPKIIIKEYDKTKPGSVEYANFSVVVPGILGEGTHEGFDENGVIELNSQTQFDEIIGKTSDENHMGNQIAWELLGLGYTVLYKKIDSETPYGTGQVVGLSALATSDYWEALKDKATYDFRYIMSGYLSTPQNVGEEMVKVAEFVNTDIDDEGDTGRGDCVALLDIDKEAYEGESAIAYKTAIGNIAEEANKISSKYATWFAPYVTYNMVVDDEYGENCSFPASFHYLACAARAFENYNEWYAIAGVTRGVSKYSIATTGIKLGDAAIDILEPRNNEGDAEVAVNLIVKIKGNYYLWGNRTAAALESELRASHFLNIRQLCCTIKKQVYVACRKFTFDPNSDVLWINFKNAIKPTLEAMKADQGIEDYKFIKVATDKKAKLCAKIRIVPIEAVEDFDISLMLEDSLEGITVGEE